jgi:intein-encoded DNA endonuclease-like protein
MEKNIENLIIEDYLNGFLSNFDLSIKYNLHRGTIQRILKKNNIVLRKRTPKIRVNHLFFNQYNELSCYWAGFILADGYIRNKNRNTLHIKLTSNDVGHLYKFKSDVGYEGNVVNKNGICYIDISSSQIINDLLNNFEITTKKSLNCFISEKIPQKYLNHFIRGYFDGDGSITYTTTDTINFVGTSNTMNFIRNYFYGQCGIKLRSKDIPDIIKNNNIFSIYYSGISAFRCLNVMYDDSNIFLDRKYLKYLDIFRKFNPE